MDKSFYDLTQQPPQPLASRHQRATPGTADLQRNAFEAALGKAEKLANKSDISDRDEDEPISDDVDAAVAAGEPLSELQQATSRLRSEQQSAMPDDRANIAALQDDALANQPASAASTELANDEVLANTAVDGQLPSSGEFNINSAALPISSLPEVGSFTHVGGAGTVSGPFDADTMSLMLTHMQRQPIPASGSWNFQVLNSTAGIDAIQLHLNTQGGWNLRMAVDPATRLQSRRYMDELCAELNQRGFRIDDLSINTDDTERNAQ